MIPKPKITVPRQFVQEWAVKCGVAFESVLPAIVGDTAAERLTIDQGHEAWPMPAPAARRIVMLCVESIPREKWPAWAAAVADTREPADKGIGDTIERKLASAGKAYKAMLAAVGAPCGCCSRQAELNRLYPYG